LTALHKEYQKVFNNDLRQGYNHTAGRFYAEFTFSNKPPPTRVFTPQYNKKCADSLQAKCDQLEQQGVLVDPKRHDISVIHVSPSWIQQKGRAKHKNLQDCTLDELPVLTISENCLGTKKKLKSCLPLQSNISKLRYHHNRH